MRRKSQDASHRLVERFILITAFVVLLPLWAYAQSNADDCAQMKKDYDNLAAQMKALIEYKNKALDMEDTIRQFDLVKEGLIKEKEGALKQIAELKEKLKGQDANIVKLDQEKEEYKKSFEKAAVENIISDEKKKKIADQEKERENLSQKAKDLESRLRLMEGASLKEQAQTEFFKRQLEEIKAKYQEAKAQNKVLEKKLDDAPKRFAELARENKVLIKRTGTMHYNLGVFYTQNKEFDRAIAEFEKAVELNPEDSASHFNLGYIYAEHLQNRPRAVTHFKQFLKLAKRDDKDADWAKRYILTWQAWEGNVPIK